MKAILVAMDPKTLKERRVQSELRSQVRRAEKDLPRLHWFLHGGERPVTGLRRRRKPDPRQGLLFP